LHDPFNAFFSSLKSKHRTSTMSGSSSLSFSGLYTLVNSELAHPVFFPDNVPRRDRALQLSNDITVMQQSVVEARDAMNKMDERMIRFLDELLKNHGMATFTELQKKLEATLTPEEKEQYLQVHFCD
jgi:hypothetical protein